MKRKSPIIVNTAPIEASDTVNHTGKKYAVEIHNKMNPSINVIKAFVIIFFLLVI